MPVDLEESYRVTKALLENETTETRAAVKAVIKIAAEENNYEMDKLAELGMESFKRAVSESQPFKLAVGAESAKLAGSPNYLFNLMQAQEKIMQEMIENGKKFVNVILQELQQERTSSPELRV